MPSLIIQIEAFVDDSFPGWVECTFIDAYSKQHRFIEKVPVVTSEVITKTSAFPRKGVISCEIESSHIDSSGENLIQVTTERPFDVVSSGGMTRFFVKEEVLIRQ
jgi:hypothetical protein